MKRPELINRNAIDVHYSHHCSHTCIRTLLTITTLSLGLQPGFSHNHEWRDPQFNIKFERDLRIFFLVIKYSQTFSEKTGERNMPKEILILDARAEV